MLSLGWQICILRMHMMRRCGIIADGACHRDFFRAAKNHRRRCISLYRECQRQQ